MSIVLRLVLIGIAFLSCLFVVQRIRKSQMRIEDTLFWLIIAGGTLILGIFPQIGFKCAAWLGIQSPVNFVFLVFIFILLFKVFILTVQVSQLQEKVKNLAQEVAIKEYNYKKKKEDISK